MGITDTHTAWAYCSKTSRRIRSALTANSYEGKEILNEEPYLHIIHMQNGNEEIRTPAPFMAYLVSNQTSSTDLEYISRH